MYCVAINPTVMFWIFKYHNVLQHYWCTILYCNITGVYSTLIFWTVQYNTVLSIYILYGTAYTCSVHRCNSCLRFYRVATKKFLSGHSPNLPYSSSLFQLKSSAVSIESCHSREVCADWQCWNCLIVTPWVWLVIKDNVFGIYMNNNAHNCSVPHYTVL